MCFNEYTSGPCSIKALSPNVRSKGFNRARDGRKRTIKTEVELKPSKMLSIFLIFGKGYHMVTVGHTFMTNWSPKVFKPHSSLRVIVAAFASISQPNSPERLLISVSIRNVTQDSTEELKIRTPIFSYDFVKQVHQVAKFRLRRHRRGSRREWFAWPRARCRCPSSRRRREWRCRRPRCRKTP